MATKEVFVHQSLLSILSSSSPSSPFTSMIQNTQEAKRVLGIGGDKTGWEGRNYGIIWDSKLLTATGSPFFRTYARRVTVKWRVVRRHAGRR
jgi:hypothetical protein